MEENYRKWHNHSEQQLAAHIQAAEDKAAADAEARRRRYGPLLAAHHLAANSLVLVVTSTCPINPCVLNQAATACNLVAGSACMCRVAPTAALQRSPGVLVSMVGRHCSQPGSATSMSHAALPCPVLPRPHMSAGARSSRLLSTAATSSSWHARLQHRRQLDRRTQHSGGWQDPQPENRVVWSSAHKLAVCLQHCLHVQGCTV